MSVTAGTMPRAYTKKDSTYWGRHAAPQPQQSVAAAPAPVRSAPFPEIVYGSTTLNAIASTTGPQTLSRGPGVNSGLSDPSAFANIRALPGSFTGLNGNRGYVGCSEAIDLCIKAWTGISVARNAVEVAVEFSSQPLHVKSDNATVLKFFTEWLRAAKIPQLVPQYFRGYYREGSVFTYTSYGMFGQAYYTNFQQAFGAKENKVPIRYEVLNPANVFVPAGMSYPHTYVRMLSPWECQRLREPVTEQDKQVLKDLSPEARDQILNGSSNAEGIYLRMDPKRLNFSFYKKQGWEPMGIPMLWPVLPDLEWKLTLKKMDMRLSRTIEHAILLVKNGEAPNQYNGGNGINQNNIARLQALFQNPTINRVLVADYTTEAQWLIPDIQEILGPEKYEVVNHDIAEGLQSILTGGDKFANAQIKAKIFIQRLEEGQRCFLDDFLLPQIQVICEAMGFRSVPSISFQPIDLQDEAVMARIYATLTQIGAITPDQALKAMQTQVLPDSAELLAGQEALKKARDKGLFQPLVGGQKDDEGTGGANGRPSGTTGIKQSGTRSTSPIGTSKAAKRDEAFSMTTYGECLVESETLAKAVEAGLRKRHGVKGAFNEAQTKVAHKLVQAIISSRPRGEWAKAAVAAIAKPPVVADAVAKEIEAISTERKVDRFDAALLRHCRTEAPVETL